MSRVFQNFDLSAVRQPEGYADKDYKGSPFTPEIPCPSGSRVGLYAPRQALPR